MGLLLKAHWFLNPQIPQIHNSDGFLYRDLLGAIKPAIHAQPVIYSILVYLLLFSQAIAINHVVNSRKLMLKPNYLPGMSFLIITSFFDEWNVLSSPLIVSTLLIWIYTKLTFFYKSPRVKSTLFNLGLAIGIGSFFYFPSLVILILVIFSLIATRPFRFAEWVLPVLGIITCWYFVFAIFFLTDRLYSFSLQNLQVVIPSFSYEPLEYAGMGMLAALIAAGGYQVQIHASKQLVQVRKSWTLLFLYLFVTLLVPFIHTNYYLEYFVLAAAPASAVVAAALFYPKSRWMTAVITWILVGYVIYMAYVV